MKKEPLYSVYKHTTPSGKVYIGVTCQNPETRWKKGKAYKDNEHFYRAIEKYGWENIKHDVLYTGLTKNKAYSLEIGLIASYDATNPQKGYNTDKGGKGSHYGHIPTNESREKRRQKMLGKFSGKYVGGKSQRAKKIWQYDLSGNFIKEWNASTEIQSALGFDYSGVIKCCTGAYTSSNGFIWTYAGECDTAKDKARKHGMPRVISDEQKAVVSEKLKGRIKEKIRKRVIGINKRTGLVFEFDAISETKKYGFEPANVSKICYGANGHNTAKGYTFMFASC